MTNIMVKMRSKNSIPPELLILEKRRQDEARDVMLKQADYLKKTLLSSQWENDTDARIQRGTINKRVRNLKLEKENELTIRRQKLKSLLWNEHQMYKNEINSKEISFEDRQIDLRNRVTTMREKNEAMRQEKVRQKYLQRWRNDCDDIRRIHSEKFIEDVKSDRDNQILFKKQEEEALKAEEKKITELWYADIEAKKRREEREAKAKAERDEDTARVLLMQLGALKMQQEEAAAVRAEEGRKLLLECQQRAEEEMNAHKLKESKARLMAQDLAKYNEIAMRARRRQMKEDALLDMKIIDDTMAAEENERTSRIKRKLKLQEEMQMYRKYLQDSLEAEKEQEKVMEKYREQEIYAAEKKRIDQWERERKARAELMKEVIKVRKEQLAEKAEAEKIRAEEEVKIREQLLKDIEEGRIIEIETRKAQLEKEADYARQLRAQIAYNAEMNSRRKKADDDEIKWSIMAEEQYQKELVEEVARIRREPRNTTQFRKRAPEWRF
eukprot:Nk52_evm4s229 gene=Nk52_evmTU4s229